MFAGYINHSPASYLAGFVWPPKPGVKSILWKYFTGDFLFHPRFWRKMGGFWTKNELEIFLVNLVQLMGESSVFMCMHLFLSEHPALILINWLQNEKTSFLSQSDLSDLINDGPRSGRIIFDVPVQGLLGSRFIFWIVKEEDGFDRRVIPGKLCECLFKPFTPVSSCWQTTQLG